MTETSDSLDLPSFPFAREHGAEPPALNAKLQHAAPISKVQLFDGTPAWIITQHKYCREALASDKLSADRRAPGYPEIHPGGAKAKEATPTFVNLDDPEHAQQRGVLERLFEPEFVQKKWRPMMEQTVDDILDKFIEKGKREQPIDLMEHFAIPVPTQIIYKALGVPEKDVERLSQDSEVRNSTSRNAAETANNELQDYMHGLVESKIKTPGDDIISTLVVEQYKLGKLSKEFLTTLAFLVLTAGNAALLNSIGLGTMTLLEHPDQLKQFKEKPELAGQVVNEITRYHTASALNSRRAVKEDTTIGGVQLKKGDGVVCSVQAANRDKRQFEDPERFDIHRKMSEQDSLGFGYGPHRCQAEAFSRVELEVALTKLFGRLPKLRLAKEEEQLTFTEPTMNVGITELPVYFE